MEAVAKALAKTLGEDAGTRQFLKQEALKRFDGDYDVLYGPFATQHTDFNKRVAASVASVSSDEIGLDAVLKRIPNLNVSVPVHIDTWDAEKLAPLVVFIPIGFSERTTKQLKAYDQYGQVQWLDAKQAPDFPIIAVGYSERISKQEAAEAAPGTIPKGKFGTNKIVDSESGGGGGGGGGGTLQNGICRTDKQTEFLRSMWMADVSEYEAWVLGDPEIKLQVVSPAGSGGTLSATVLSAKYVMGRRTIEDTYRCDSRLYYWDKAYLGGVVAYVWIEEDYGDIADVKFTFGYTPKTGPATSVEVTYKIANHDDEIGKCLVFFDECPSQGYYNLNGGSTEFRWTTENRP